MSLTRVIATSWLGTGKIVNLFLQRINGFMHPIPTLFPILYTNDVFTWCSLDFLQQARGRQESPVSCRLQQRGSLHLHLHPLLLFVPPGCGTQQAGFASSCPGYGEPRPGRPSGEERGSGSGCDQGVADGPAYSCHSNSCHWRLEQVGCRQLLQHGSGCCCCCWPSCCCCCWPSCCCCCWPSCCCCWPSWPAVGKVRMEAVAGKGRQSSRLKLERNFKGQFHKICISCSRQNNSQGPLKQPL